MSQQEVDQATAILLGKYPTKWEIYGPDTERREEIGKQCWFIKCCNKRMYWINLVYEDTRGRNAPFGSRLRQKTVYRKHRECLTCGYWYKN
jgi:hypothetical protein